MLDRRRERTSARNYLEEAIDRAREAVAVTPKHDPDRTAWLNRLKNLLNKRFEQTGKIEHLEESIRRTEEVVDATPNDDPSRAAMLDSLGMMLYSRYQYSQTIENLEDTIKRAQEAVAATRGNGPDRAGRSNIVETLLGFRYKLTRRTEDQNSEESLRRALEPTTTLAPSDRLENTGPFRGLRNKLVRRYGRTEKMRNFKEAVEQGQEAVTATPSDYLDRADRPCDLESNFALRYERTETMRTSLRASHSNQPLHKALDAGRREIRLLSLRPTTMLESPIECTLEKASLDDSIRYLALSYVWGDPNVTENVIVNGFNIPVTTNLVAALRQMRQNQAEACSPFHQLPSLLWVDAISINQDDLLERSSQVRIMGHIYRRTQKVISWLGSEACESTLAMMIILFIHEEVASLSKRGDMWSWLEKYPELTSNLNDRNPWHCVQALWEREYWKRVWVLQEMVLAKDILLVCGEISVPWEHVIKVEEWASSLRPDELRPWFIKPVDWWIFTGKRTFDAGPVRKTQILRSVRNLAQHENYVKKLGFLPMDLGRALRAKD